LSAPRFQRPINKRQSLAGIFSCNFSEITVL
jgi:hypothetical protein